MTESKGRLFAIKLGNGATSETFTAVGGMRTSQMTINNALVDVTTADSAPWRKAIGNTGIRTVSISGSGVCQDDATFASLRTAAMSGTLNNYELVNGETGDKIGGSFACTSFQESGEYTDALTFSITLESAGTVTFTAA